MTTIPFISRKLAFNKGLAFSNYSFLCSILFFLWVSAGLILLKPSIGFCDSKILEGIKAIWTSEIKEDQYVNDFPNNGEAPFAPIYLWVKFKGNQEMLEIIKEGAFPPLYTKWFYYTTIRASFVEDAPERIYTRKSFAEYQKEFDERGYVTWTYILLLNEKKRKGLWEVDLFFKDHSPISCYVNNRLENCNFKIHLGRLNWDTD